MNRIVKPEILDELAPDDPLAVGSRRDLRRLNRRMHSATILASAISDVHREAGPSTLVELGAGDGSLLLEVARKLGPEWRGSRLLLLDRQDLLSQQMAAEYRALGWQVSVLKSDLEVWLSTSLENRSDLIICNLFLHHFPDQALARFLPAIGDRTRAFVALEPRRWILFGVIARMLWMMGCNRVTRHDAQVSVRAGFADSDLGRFWPEGPWLKEERAAGIFSHLFTAQRR